MGRLMNPILSLLAWPKKVAAVDEAALVYLNGKTARILFAVAEAVIGADFKDKVPNFITTIDEYLGYQRRSSRQALTQALLLVESSVVILLLGGGLHGFSHLSIADRQRVLSRMKDHNQQLLRNLYAACVNIAASTFYASEATWDEIQYDGVSVDHPEILAVPRWRPDDPRPVEK